jgi:hypothetical protein
MRSYSIGFLLALFSFGAITGVVVPEGRYDSAYWEDTKDHPGFYPYLCEFSYRTLADHIIDAAHREFHPELVKKGDIIYVGVWYLEWFIDHIHDKILYPYILITCDVGGYLPEKSMHKLLFDPKVAYWFAKNMLFTNHSKLFQLPMGQFYYLWAHGIPSVIQELDSLVATKPHPKNYLLYLNYTERDHARRKEVADRFWDKPYCLNRNRPRMPTSFSDFWREVSQSKFVLSPLGLEVDCTRTWECFILGSIPIVERSFLDPLYDKLPILLVHSWDEITEDFLNQKYSKMQDMSYCVEKAFFPYWQDLILEKQRSVQRGETFSSSLEANSFSKEDLADIKAIFSEKKKLHTPLIYQGNLTYLRPYQLENEIKTIPSIFLYDLWTKNGFSDMKKFCANSRILKNSKVSLNSPVHGKCPKKQKGCKSHFLDLTHFRHSLFLHTRELSNFCHSLEKDVYDVYRKLGKGDLLVGNMFFDDYVHEVLQRLEKTRGVSMSHKGNFWYCIKQ